MARKRKRRLTPDARRKRLLKSLQISGEQFSYEQMQAEEKYRVARDKRADNQLAEYIGGRHFGSKHRLLWECIRHAFDGCCKISWRETLDEFSVNGQGRRLRKRRAANQTRPVERLLHDALLRQHARNFDKLCEHLAWLCEELLPRVLYNPNRTFIGKRDDDFCWRIQILHTALPPPKDLTTEQRKRFAGDRRDFVRITRAFLKDAELRANLLALYFLYPETKRSTRGGKINPRRERRPLFCALDDICNHWQQRQENPYTPLLDVLAWNFDDFKGLKDQELARALFKRCNLDFDQWCKNPQRDPADVVRHLNRAMTDQLHLREKRRRS
jgi:hypothetical protein